MVDTMEEEEEEEEEDIPTAARLKATWSNAYCSFI